MVNHLSIIDKYLLNKCDFVEVITLNLKQVSTILYILSSLLDNNSINKTI